jgi:hypothetical protein
MSVALDVAVEEPRCVLVRRIESRAVSWNNVKMCAMWCDRFKLNQEVVLLGTVRAGVHLPIKLVSVPAPISFFPAVKPRSAVHTDRQNRCRRLQGGQFRE